MYFYSAMGMGSHQAGKSSISSSFIIKLEWLRSKILDTILDPWIWILTSCRVQEATSDGTGAPKEGWSGQIQKGTNAFHIHSPYWLNFPLLAHHLPPVLSHPNFLDQNLLPFPPHCFLSTLFWHILSCGGHFIFLYFFFLLKVKLSSLY